LLESVFFQGWFCVPLPTAPVRGRGTLGIIDHKTERKRGREGRIQGLRRWDKKGRAGEG
jgi:hypothetical protein